MVRSWTKGQQIVYHLLRYFIKHTLGSDNEIISNYHLKTIMLWKCEEKDGTFWNESQLIAIVSFAISCLVHNLNSKKLLHYFVATCNFFDSDKVRNNRTECEQLTLKLIPFTTVERLIDWFMEKYLVVAYEKIPDQSMRSGFQWTHDVSFKVASIRSTGKAGHRRKLFQEVKILFIERHYNTTVQRSNADLKLCSDLIMNEVRKTRHDLIFDHDRCNLFLGELPQVDERLVEIFRAVALLFLASDLQGCHCLRLQPKIIDATVNLIGDSSDSEWVEVRSAFRNDSPEAYFSKARYLPRLLKIRTCSKGLILTLANTCLLRALKVKQPFP